MEDLFASIESSEVMLSAQDALFSFANHPLVHFYENTSNGGSHIGFMPSAVLQASLYTALKDFPLLLGHIKDGPGGLAKIVVDKHGLNLPEFVESESSIHYQSLKEAQFKWSTWPKGVATVGPTTAPNKHGAIKLLNVHIVRLHEDSGLILFCNIPHYILDGFGYYAFLSHWAAICRTFCRQEPPLTEQHCQPLYTFDRAIVDEGLQDILSLDAGEESLAKVASQATLALGGITAPLVGEFVDFLNANPNAYARYAAYMAAATNVLTIIDERGYHTQSVDFGHGGPTWVSGIPWHIPNFVAFFASPARPGDVDVYVSHSPRVADALAKDAFFAKYARLLF
ncbi:hypothetical protein GGI02_000722 [Coemansia sp. RSA 2322]|nr:hypothetical protein GGI02_000722 [Coemansia sp. RSA 2322]